jgi:hypothetical protein
MILSAAFIPLVRKWWRSSDSSAMSRLLRTPLRMSELVYTLTLDQ